MENNKVLIFKKTIIVSAFILLTNLLHTQEYKLPDFSPIAPKEQEFVKYMSCPVSEYTGIPEIQIPIYNISVNEINVPIALSYYAKGIKVNQEASWVGLGWDMNIGGSVIQKVQDLDDLDDDLEKILPDYIANYENRIVEYAHKDVEDFTLPECEEDIPYYYNPTGGACTNNGHSYFVFTDYYIPVYNEYSCTQYPELFNRDQFGNFETNQVDSEPDIFIADFLGQRVEFILDFDDFSSSYSIEILNTKKYRVIKTNNGWQITSPDGTVFDFAQCDVTILEDAQTGTNPQSRIQTRNWKLVKIKLFNGKEINLSYGTYSTIYNVENLSQSYERLQRESVFQYGGGFVEESRLKSIISSGGFVIFPPHPDKYSSTYQTISYLNEINTPEGTIRFVLSDRDDLDGSKKVDSIVICNSNNETVKRFKLTYSYFESFDKGNCYTTTRNQHALGKRLKLVSIREIGIPPFQFFYNALNLPLKTSFAVDYWGYYNGVSNNTSYLANTTRFNHNNGITPSSNGNNHSAFEPRCKASVLEKIIYPTGGFTTYEYELNSFKTSDPVKQIPDYFGLLSEESLGNGLRIKRITKFSNDQVPVKMILYSYFEGCALDGTSIISHPRYNELMVVNQGTSSAFCKVFGYSGFLTSSNNFFTVPLFGTGGVGYSKVIIEEISNTNNNGMIEKYFANHSNIIPLEDINLPSIAPSVKNGLLIAEIVYDSTMNKVLQNNNFYHSEVSELFYGVRFTYDGWFYHGYFIQNAPYFLGVNELQFLAGMYPISSSETLLDSTYTIQYFGNDSLTAITKYSYDSKRQTSNVSSTDSKGLTYEKQFTYPYSIIGFQNRINKPNKIIERTESTIIAKTEIMYSTDNDGLILPRSISYAQGIYNNGRKIIYDDYDVKGNLTQYHLGDIQNPYFNYNINFITYLWGYNYTYPIAKIENATFAEVLNHLDYAQLQTKSSDELKIIFNDLRNEMPNSMISSFTYDPLIGATTITDPNGILITYDYDDNNRLETISDTHENILKHIDYNYFNPSGK